MSEKIKQVLEKARYEFTCLTDDILKELESPAVGAKENIEDNRIESILCNLPEQIKSQTAKVEEYVVITEYIRKNIAEIEADVDEIILNDVSLTNVDKRKAAKKQALAKRDDYKELSDELAKQNRDFRKEQIELEYLHNLFRAYLAIVEMRGVRL